MMPILTEDARLNALNQLSLLDTPPSEAFDRITRMAAQLFGLPIAAVSLTDHDRQWFKSRVGVEHWSIPREKAPCAQVADSAECVVLPDLLADSCYHDSLLAQSGIRFYAGAPLITRDGFCLGAMCVLGTEPRQVSSIERGALVDLAAMVMAQIELQHAFGRVDPNSGLSNRNQFIEDVTDLARDQPQDEQRLLVLIDLAGSEQLNSAARVMGPSYLDDLVREAVQVIHTCLGVSHKIYHVAATQFAFLAPSGAEPESYTRLLEAELVTSSSHSRQVFLNGLAIGIAPFSLGASNPRDALRIAHSAAQDARAAGVRTSTYSSSHDAAHQRRFRLLQDFPEALEAPDQLRLVYQPRIDLASLRCVGAEALLRWVHPDLGPISPGEFIPLVEQTSMGQALTSWVLDAALAQLATWHSTLNLRLSINVSAGNLGEGDFADRIKDALQRHGVMPGCLELEVTESAVMQNTTQGLAMLHLIVDAGICVAIDDFGTGYSSLSYLQRLPAQVVKIDQSFMQDIAVDQRKRALVTSIISLSHDLGYRVVAEGVEHQVVLDLVKAAACDEVQGYFFARPMPAEDFEAWMQSYSSQLPHHTASQCERAL
ncbi:MAG: sensor domain-containing phosphodiesterase [Oxalobacteraceae bacterium]|nr:MAG: sensor domain-containing phosphodiesterase [Oxalobacteraceae bacterium]